jgi:hypothetical protein
MRHLILVDPPSRINDHWISSDKINADPIIYHVSDNRLAGKPNDLMYRFQADFYKKFACDIVSETVLQYPYAYISEKTLRPIACKRMFVILGAPGTLKLLQDKGFFTFGDFIDESYDDIVDSQARFLSVVAEIEKLCCMPLPKVKQYLHSIKSRLEHNFTVLQNLQSQELENFSKILNHDYT